MTQYFLYWAADGWPVVVTGGAPEGSIVLTQAQQQEIREAFSRGDRVVRDSAGWSIEPFIPSTEEVVLRIQSQRRAAMAAEADPLFFKWQSGEALKEEWEAKREEIRARYPYPDEVPA